MKFEDAKLDMKVISDGPLKIKGTIVAIDDKYRNVRVKGERVTLWFFEKPNEPDSEYDLTYLKIDPKAKSVDNPPKFDIGLMDSDEFIKYVWTLIEKYEKEFLPDGIKAISFNFYKNGKIAVEDSKGNKASSKCHHNDAFNVETGIRLAIQRLAEKAPFIPKEGQEYWGIWLTNGKPLYMTYNSTFYDHIINMAIGNCFRTDDEALKHRHEIWKRLKELIAYAKTLNK